MLTTFSGNHLFYLANTKLWAILVAKRFVFEDIFKRLVQTGIKIYYLKALKPLESTKIGTHISWWKKYIIRQDSFISDA